MEKYIKGKILGVGQFGSVVKATVKETGQEVAIKKVKLVQAKEGIHVTALREIKVLKELHDPHVIELVDVFISSSQNLSIVLELMESDLEAVIRDSSLVLSPADIKSYMLMALKGLEACHAHHVVHRDIKPNNLLTAKSGLLKLADFGLAKVYGSPPGCRTSQVFARWYRAPELLWGSTSYGPAVDVWAMGCVFAELMLRRPWFVAESDIKQLQTIFSTLGTPSAEQWKGMSDLPSFVQFSPSPAVPLRSIFPQAHDDALDLLSAMMRFNPSERITTKQALKHRFFTSGVQPTSPERLPKPKSRADAPLGAPQDGQPGGAVPPGFCPVVVDQELVMAPAWLSKGRCTVVDSSTAIVHSIHAQHGRQARALATPLPCETSPQAMSPWHTLSPSDESSISSEGGREMKRCKSSRSSVCLRSHLLQPAVQHLERPRVPVAQVVMQPCSSCRIHGSPLDALIPLESVGDPVVPRKRVDAATGLQIVEPRVQSVCSPDQFLGQRLTPEGSGTLAGPPDLLGRLQASKATPQLWGTHSTSAMQPRLPLTTRSPNKSTACAGRSATGEMPSSWWTDRGVCPGALDTVEYSHPLYTMSREHDCAKSPVPTPVKDTVRKNLFGA